MDVSMVNMAWVDTVIYGFGLESGENKQIKKRKAWHHK